MNVNNQLINLTLFDNQDGAKLVNLTDDQKAVLIKIIGEVGFMIANLRDWVNNDSLTKNMQVAIPSLLESNLTQLFKVLDYDSTLARERDGRFTAIKAANQKVKDLQEQLASLKPIDGLSEQLRQLQQKVYGWWKHEGLGHVSDFVFTEGGYVRCTLNCTLHRGYSSLVFSDTPISDEAKQADHVVQLKALGLEFQAKSDNYLQVLDTAENRKIIQHLLEARFPSVLITKYHGWHGDNTNDVYLLDEVEVYIYNLGEI